MGAIIVVRNVAPIVTMFIERLFQEKILSNAVDTGWVTDMAPGGVGVLASIHETQVAPPLDEVDGAARVLDPVFSHINDPTGWRQRGKLWKDYRIVRW